MSQLKVHSKILSRITCFVGAILNVEYNSMRGFEDTKEKFYCAYIAKNLTGMGDGVISTFYRVNTKYMLNKFEDVQIALQIDNDLVLKLNQVKSFYELIVVNETFDA